MSERISGYRRPAMPGPQAFEAQAEDADPAELAAAGHRIAHLLVRGPHDAAAKLRDRG